LTRSSIKRPRKTFPCPHCGDDVPAGAKACPHCGADEETGWAEDADYTALDLPERDEHGDYIVEDESSSGLPAWVIVTVIVVIVVFALLAIFGR